jgi:hypothetical protein
MADFTFETEWAGGPGAIDRSQRLSAAVAAAGRALAASVGRDAGGAETPGSISEHLDALLAGVGDVGRALEAMAGQVVDMRRRNVLMSVNEEGAQARRAGEADAALREAAEGARRLAELISGARPPLLDLALTDEAGTAVWELYQ